MLRRIPRFLRVTMLLAAVVTVALAVLQSWSSGSPGTGGWTQTQWGPLGPGDRDLLVRVRQAGLWEQPTGQQATQQASSPAVREIGRHIAGEHGTLDAEVRTVADQLGVLLPTSPSAQQQGWMAEISARTGSDYDRVFVQRLREAHGTVLGLVAQVRTGTRNSLVRSFADTADQFVRRHIGYLESTGLVDFTALPAPPGPSVTDQLVPFLVVVAALLAAVGFVVAFRRRSGAPRVSRVDTTAAVPGRPLAAPGPPPGPPVSGPSASGSSASGSSASGPSASGPFAAVPRPRAARGTRASPVSSTGPRHAVPPGTRVR